MTLFCRQRLYALPHHMYTVSFFGAICVYGDKVVIFHYSVNLAPHSFYHDFIISGLVLCTSLLSTQIFAVHIYIFRELLTFKVHNCIILK